jgi:predicted small metal-binding protein
MSGISTIRPATAESVREEPIMSAHQHPKTTHHIACAHVVPGCDFTASARTEDDLLEQVVAHAQQVHGVADLTPELAAAVKAAIERR